MTIARIAFRARIAWAAAGLVAAAAAIGGLHTAQGMVLLRWAGLPCPATRASAADVLRAREQGLGAIRSDRRAPAHSALRFVLESTTRADAQAWAAANGVACTPVERGLQFLRCRGFDARLLGVAGPPVSELWLSFRPDGRLIGVDVYRRGLADADAALAWSDAAGRMRAALGAPSRAFGEAAPSELRGGALRTARIEYRFSDAMARLTAANLPHAGLAVREQYLSAMR